MGTTARRSDIWTGAQLAGWLAAAARSVATPSLFVIVRETLRHGGRETRGPRATFQLPNHDGSTDESGFQEWLARNQATGAEQHKVAILVIRETLDEDDRITECILERRIGAVDGPYFGHPARVEFMGAVRAVRLYGFQSDQTGGSNPGLPRAGGGADRTGSLLRQSLVELPPPEGRFNRPDPTALMEAFAGEGAALHAHLGAGVIVLARRSPNLFEDAIGLSTVAHVRIGDRVTGCGIGWHGTLAFVLVADFVRLDQPLALPPDQDAAIDSVLNAHDLVRHEVRIDRTGAAVLARRRNGPDLFILRHDGTTVRVERHRANQRTDGSADQQRWLRYAETHEGRTILDTHLTQPSKVMVVVSGDADGQVWRHEIDPDGIEIDRGPANDTAMGTIFREQLGQITDADAPAPASSDAPTPAPTPMRTPARDDLLAQARALSRTLADPLKSESDDTPFGADFDDRFPSAVFHLREAHRCLVFRRSTATALHLGRILRIGLRALARFSGIPDIDGKSWEGKGWDGKGWEGKSWTAIMRTLRAQPNLPAPLLDAIRQVRRCWSAPDMNSADKFTEEEAELLMEAVGRFMILLSDLCDEEGNAIPTD